MSKALQLAVVGHTNTGKTSLARTLARDTRFGRVDDSPGTTRHVEGIRLTIEGEQAIEWFDTPGMEDSVALRDYIDTLCAGERLDGPDQIRRFLNAPEASRRFEQEARVLNKMLHTDAALYVIDARDPVLAKHRDELALLAACGKPILPVLNFTSAPAHRAQAWRDAMARLGLHVQADFDTVLPPLDGEAQLYDRLAILLDAHGTALRALSASLGRQRAARRTDAQRLLANLLIDAAALHASCVPDDASVAAATDDLRTRIRTREQQFVEAVLTHFRFGHDDYLPSDLPLAGERWGMDLFHPQALKDMGIQVGTGVAAGAAAGAAVDLMTAGLSLGTGTLVGAAAGGAWTSLERLGKRMAGKLRGHREISVDDAVLRLLAVRGRALIAALDRRGHAATQPLVLDQTDDATNDAAWRKGPLPDALKEARSRPEWSALSDAYEEDDRRRKVVDHLVAALARPDAI
ncbi:MAG: GTPase/DUF3482 domain-containing protein [Burkholderiaceae bacterium]